MTRIVIITRSFPYLTGETYIESEAPFWDHPDCEVVVMPWKTGPDAREVPATVTIDHTIADITPREKYRARALTPLSPLFWKEIAGLRAMGRLDRATAQEAFRAVSGALVIRDALSRWIAENGPIDVVYSYWWDTWTYGAQLLKGHGVGHVVSRTHGYDLYEERHPSGYLGLKRQLGPQLDRLLSISKGGVRLVQEVYGLPERVVQLAPLGVKIPSQPAAVSSQGELRLVSVAAMVPMKRLDRMVAALGLLAEQHPELRVRWTHFGDGPLQGEVEAAVAELPQVDHLAVELPGNIPNEKISEYFAQNPVDLFVNTSDSEGVPVSIMEAMAFGIPSLATDVGGVGDLVPQDGPGGQLMGEDPTPQQIADTIWAWRDRAKEPAERAAAREIADRTYDQAKNYAGLMDQLVAISKS
ncbi:MAG: glycosyltransferase [Luteococcus japonicus]